MSLVGLLLAAGRSERFGPGDKLLAALDGRPLVTHAAEALRQAGCDRLLAVTASGRVAGLLPGYLVVTPAPGPAAQSASLRAGIESAQALGADHVLIALADMPRVTPTTLQQVITAGRAHGAACATDGQVRMPPALFGRDAFPGLLARDGDAGARPLLSRIPDAALVRAEPDTLLDIDTPSDLARAGS